MPKLQDATPGQPQHLGGVPIMHVAPGALGSEGQ